MHYLDNSATTKVYEAARQRMDTMMEECFGNPSSVHQAGVAAAAELRRARQSVAAGLGCAPESVIFTSGGTEADNMAIFGLADRHLGSKIVTTDAEHPAVLESVRELGRRGFEVVFLPTFGGAPDMAEAAKVIDDDTALVVMMLVNNETGAIFPVDKVGAHIRAHSKAKFHIDAVQAFGRVPFSPKMLSCDTLAVSSHKIGGPKGVGALYIAPGVHLTRTVFGGGQEGGIRSGTENMPGIVGFGAAVEETFRDGTPRRTAIRSLRDYAAAQLQKAGAVINNPPRPAPHILNFSVPGFKAEPTLNRLSELGICVSAGSACSAGKKRHSHVLTAMGLPEALLDSALRCSMCLETTKDDIDALVAAVASITGNNQR